MFKTCLENRITYRQTSYKCYLCHYETSKNNFDLVCKHMENIEHKQKLNKINESLRKVESEQISTISESQRRKIVENHITCYDKPYFFHCHICQCSISGLVNVFSHIKGSLHHESLTKLEKKVPCKKTTNATSSINHVAKDNEKDKASKFSFVDDFVLHNSKGNFWQCFICYCKIIGEPNVLQHIEGDLHQSRLKKQNLKETNNPLEKENIQVQPNLKCDLIKMLCCRKCQIGFNSTTFLKCHCMLHLNQELSLQDIDIMQFNFNKNKDTIIKCLLCDINVTEGELNSHIESDRHLNRIDLFFYIKDDLEFNDSINSEIDDKKLTRLKFKPTNDILTTSYCKGCRLPMLEKDVKEHLEEKKHNTEISKILYFKFLSLDLVNINIDVSNFYMCFICNKSYHSAQLLFKHYKGIEHKRKIKCFNMLCKDFTIKFKKLKKEEIIQCTLCNVNMHSSRTAIEHLLGKRHRAEIELLLKQNNISCSSNNENLKIEKVNENNSCIKASTSSSKKPKNHNQFDTSPEELIKLGFSAESLHSHNSIEPNFSEMDDVLNDLVQLDLNRSQQKKLQLMSKQRKPRAPNTEQKKNSPFNKNVLLFGKNFIKLCIDSEKENIYNIDPEDIHLIKLGVSLTFPWESERVCLPCTQQFPNNKQLLFEHLQHHRHIKNLREMEDNDKEFEEYPDQFSDLALAKFYMQDESDDWVQCYACNTKVKNENTDIRLHNAMSNHVSKSQFWNKLSEEITQEFLTIFKEIWYYAQVFICEVCKTKFDFEIEFVMHLEKPKHLEKVNELKFKGIFPKFGTCPVCITYWYGKSDSYILHCEDKFHKRFAKNGDFMVPNMTITAVDLLNNIDEKINLLVNESDRVIQEKYKESELLKAIEETVECVYPNAKAYIFGSRLSHLGFPDSDVDVFLDCEDIYKKSTTQEQSQKYLLSVKECFEKKSMVWIIDEILLVTRVPIMKLRHIPTGLKCDISFINRLSVEKSKLIGYYNMAYPLCRELILYLKKWLTLCQISGSNCITTFAISWFVIFYLQREGILPTVYELIKLKNQSNIVDGWECGFLESISANPSNFSFQDHLKGFFSYYANFDYKTNIVSPYLGQIFEKRIFAYIDQLPEEMEIYKNRVKGDDSQVFRYDSPMCIQDPIDLSQNMTKAVKKRQLRCFRQYCIESATKVLEDRNNLTLWA